MPKKTRTSEEVQEVKLKILNMALQLINDDGYNQFSMRKLAAKLDITATTIYQYYSNKDELYLAVLTRGFEELYARLMVAYETSLTPMERLKRVVGEYVKFGITNANFYNIMLVWNVPKFNDYIGTSAEPAALVELNTALKVWNLIKRVAVESGTIKTPSLEIREIVTFQFACLIHGFISLNNSQVVDYLFEAGTGEINDEIIEKFIELAISQYGSAL